MKRWRRLAHEEDGQALLWGAGVLVLLVACFYGAMDLGQLVLGKIQAQNAADAAALSAASLKASVHNTRSLAYRATTGQLNLARLQMAKATGLAINELGGPTGKRGEFGQALRRAEWHMNKVERLRAGILAFNAWATDERNGPAMVRQVAEIGYLGNMGTLGTADRANLNLLDNPNSLMEYQSSSPLIGGVAYTGEALSPRGNAGKTMLRIEPKVGAFGGAMLGYGNKAALSAEAVAGPVPADKIFDGALGGIKAYGIQWYTVRLMPVNDAAGRQ